MSRRFSVGWTLTGLLSLTALMACGKRADPLAPYLKTPQPPSAIEVNQVGNALELRAIAPRLTTENRPLPVIELEWYQGPAAGDFTKLARPIFREEVAPGEVRTKTFPIVTAEARFSVRAFSGKARSNMSAPVAFKPVPVPSPPTNLNAVNTAIGVSLSWVNPPGAEPWPTPLLAPSPSPSPIPGTVPGVAPPGLEIPSPSPSPTPASATAISSATPSNPPLSASPPKTSPTATPAPTPLPGIRIFRTDGTPQIVRESLQASSWVDSTLKPGDKPCYALRYTVSFKPLVESASTEPVCVESKDIVPPNAPLKLVADIGSNFVELSWAASASPDVAFYRVYLALDTRARTLLLETQGPILRTRHGNMAPGARTYDVTAVDQAGNESEPSPITKIIIP